VNPTLITLQRIAEIEFNAIVFDTQMIGEKLRLLLVDQSYVDVWVARSMPERFGFHWERRHLDGTIYRYDNFPDTAWQGVSTYPRHFHDGTQARVLDAPFQDGVIDGFRDFLRFVTTNLRP
jgi:uncharacterized ferritin-like protein (DUF455 family)